MFFFRNICKNIYDQIFYPNKKKLKEELLSELPAEVLKIIMTYVGLYSDHNGKYMKRIDSTDERYNLLRTIPPFTIKIINTETEVYFESSVCFSNRYFFLEKTNRYEEYFGGILYKLFLFFDGSRGDGITKQIINTTI